MASKRDYYEVLGVGKDADNRVRLVEVILTNNANFATVKIHHPVLTYGLSGAFYCEPAGRAT